MTDIVDLTPQKLNLKLKRGDAWSFPVTFVDTDLTGWTFAAQIRKTADAADAADLDIAETDLAGGIITVGQTAAADRGVWDLQGTPPAGLPRTYISGTVTVDKDVTRP